MASTDATPLPIKNQAYRITFPIFDADGDLVTGATALDSEVSKDGGTFADCTNEATEIATASGMYYLDLTSTEMNADTVAVIVKTSSVGAKTTPIVMYPAENTDIPVNVTALGGVAQSATDLKDFADDGYDPATNKVQGVVLTDTLTTYTGNTPQTGDSFARIGATGSGLTTLATQASVNTIDDFLDTEVAAIITTLGTPAGASVSADIAAIEAQTDDIGAAGAGLTAIPWNAAWDAEVQSEVDDALVVQNLDHLVKIAVDTDFATTVHLNSVVGHLADNGTSASFDRTTDSLEVLEGKIDAVDNFIDTEVASILTAVDTEVGAIKTVTDALPNAGALTTIQSDLDDIQTRLPAALVSGRMDSNTQAMAGNVITSSVIATDAIGAAQIAADAIGSSELAATAITDIQTGLSTLTAVDVNAEVVDVLRTDTIPDSYAADGVQPTFAQAILAIQQFLMEKDVSSTTVTVKKPNGSTTAMTFTLNSPTAPTSITRAS